VLVYDGVDLLDLAGACEVFVLANMLGAAEPQGMLARAAGTPRYRLEMVSAGCGRAVTTHSGLRFVADRRVVDTPAARGVSLLVPGGDVREVARRTVVREWVSRQSRLASRVVSVCSGALLLAASGVLAGRRCTTHWMAFDSLAEIEPSAAIDRESIYVRDGDVWTSAGGTAGIDLALAIIEHDLGRAAALHIARQLVVYLHRPGGQAQFSTVLRGQQATRRPLQEVVDWLRDHLDDDLRVEVLARRAHMSERNFTRAFTAEVGVPPGRYVERLRVEHARRRIEESTDDLACIASECGFGTPDTMRRSFLRLTGVPPREHRLRFGSA
jgi:transcriptional regulator GlxA family with amidase domain